MIRRTTVFTFKITAVSLAIYFTPIGHMILSLFGVRTNAGKAYAGTVTCVGGGETAEYECGGKSGNYYPGSSVQCVCETDSAQIKVLRCEEERGSGDMWDDDRGYAYWKLVQNCHYLNACSPNGSTKDCSTAAQYCTQTCTNGRWGAYVWGNCKPGYIKLGETCFAECSVSNGKGYEVEESSSSSSSEA